MKRVALRWLCWSACWLASAALAQASSLQGEGLQWLQRVASAAEKLNYRGTFVYRNGSHSETTRIVHLVSNGRQLEKLEVLDGSPREVIRQDDEVSCYLPESRVVIVEPRTARRGFPALLPASLAGLSDYYVIRKGGTARVAGFESQIVRLEPRDPWRYGHQFWIETTSGLLLKADIFDERGESLESMAFTELAIGEPIRPEAVRPTYAAQARDHWKIRQARLSELKDDGPWQFRYELPGFRKQIALRRSFTKEGSEQGMLHWVFSDGLVAFSIFISPLTAAAEAGSDSLRTSGALSVVRRVVEGHQVVVMGDLPPAALKRFADGIAWRGK